MSSIRPPTAPAKTPRRALPTLAPVEIPAGVRAVAETYSRGGHAVFLVGETLLTLCTGAPPDAFELATSATLDETLALYDTAVPTQVAHGIATLPGHGTSIDAASFRAGTRIEDDLAHRDFTVLAMAWNPCGEEFVDPYGGHDDLARGALRCVGAAAERLVEDPVRALRAARLVATYGLEADPELEQALADAGPRLRRSDPVRVRRELVRLLLTARPSAGLALLRRTGIERRLFKPVGEDAAALVDAVPAVLHLRMAAWLRGTKTSRMLRAMRFGVERSRRVERMLAHHPLDERVAPNNDRSISRMLRLLPAEDIEALFRMRRWELERASAEEPARLDVAKKDKQLVSVRRGIERVAYNRDRSAQRLKLAIDGTEVMQLLACPPGVRVGAAMRFLGERVLEDPTVNERETLRELLLAWAGRDPDATGR